MREHLCKAKDARLFKAGLDLARSFIQEEPVVEGRNAIGGEIQEQEIQDDFGDTMGALRSELDVGKRDMNGIRRAAKKARAIRKRGG